MRHIAVLDIGKTNAKVLLIDLWSGTEVSSIKQANTVRTEGPYPHFDAEGLWSFILRGLGQLAARHRIDAISITTHGASGVLVDAEGGLALPILDYEFSGPDRLAAEYDAVRPPFAETGAPRLPMGLNLGAQIFWQAHTFPEAFARVKHILMYPQYWALRLTGVAVSEPTSLGCHTDLWNPWTGDFSTMVTALGWRGLFPELRPASAILGPILPELARATGVPPGTPVISGIHDSNASLVPWLGEPGPRAILSTGTWMIVLALGGEVLPLDARRDVLVNVNARGEPTPTARYMAGREFDEITEGRILTPTAADEAAVLSGQIMALPSLHPGTGPFPGLSFAWTEKPQGDGQRVAAASFYAALMGAECLALIGARGPSIVEGPFGGNAAFARMLATATGRPVIAAGASAGTGLGAALLAGPVLAPRAVVAPVLPQTGADWTGYVAAWRAEVGRRWQARQSR